MNGDLSFGVRTVTMIFRKTTCFLMILVFGFSVVIPPAGAQVFQPTTNLAIPTGFRPPVLIGLKVHPENPLLFDFIVDQGQTKLSPEELKSETDKLVKYFFAALAIPDDEVWVNLSPVEKDRVIPEVLGQTIMGKAMLEQDLVLKKLAATLTNPDTELGQKYWTNVRREIRLKLGDADVPVDSFNKVWIVPQSAEVLESPSIVLVGEKSLKVMMADDYEAMKTLESQPTAESMKISSEVFKNTLLPEIEREVNEGEKFAAVRQMYNSAILAAWFKKTLKESLLGKIYTDKNKVAGVVTDDKEIKQKVQQQYLETLQKGIYNFIKEDIDEVTGEMIPRKYFSGGITSFTAVNLATTPTTDFAQQPRIEAIADSGTGVSAAQVLMAEAKRERNFIESKHQRFNNETALSLSILGQWLQENGYEIEIEKGEFNFRKFLQARSGAFSIDLPQDFAASRRSNPGRLEMNLAKLSDGSEVVVFINQYLFGSSEHEGLKGAVYAGTEARARHGLKELDEGRKRATAMGIDISLGLRTGIENYANGRYMSGENVGQRDESVTDEQIRIRQRNVRQLEHDLHQEGLAAEALADGKTHIKEVKVFEVLPEVIPDFKIFLAATGDVAAQAARRQDGGTGLLTDAELLKQKAVEIAESIVSSLNTLIFDLTFENIFEGFITSDFNFNKDKVIGALKEFRKVHPQSAKTIDQFIEDIGRGIDDYLEAFAERNTSEQALSKLQQAGKKLLMLANSIKTDFFLPIGDSQNWEWDYQISQGISQIVQAINTDIQKSNAEIQELNQSAQTLIQLQSFLPEIQIDLKTNENKIREFLENTANKKVTFILNNEEGEIRIDQDGYLIFRHSIFNGLDHGGRDRKAIYASTEAMVAHEKAELQDIFSFADREGIFYSIVGLGTAFRAWVNGLNESGERDPQISDEEIIRRQTAARQMIDLAHKKGLVAQGVQTEVVPATIKPYSFAIPYFDIFVAGTGAVENALMLTDSPVLGQNAKVADRVFSTRLSKDLGNVKPGQIEAIILKNYPIAKRIEKDGTKVLDADVLIEALIKYNFQYLPKDGFRDRIESASILSKREAREVITLFVQSSGLKVVSNDPDNQVWINQWQESANRNISPSTRRAEGEVKLNAQDVISRYRVLEYNINYLETEGFREWKLPKEQVRETLLRILGDVVEVSPTGAGTFNADQFVSNALEDNNSIFKSAREAAQRSVYEEFLLSALSYLIESSGLEIVSEKYQDRLAQWNESSRKGPSAEALKFIAQRGGNKATPTLLRLYTNRIDSSFARAEEIDRLKISALSGLENVRSGSLSDGGSFRAQVYQQEKGEPELFTIVTFFVDESVETGFAILKGDLIGLSKEELENAFAGDKKSQRSTEIQPAAAPAQRESEIQPVTASRVDADTERNFHENEDLQLSASYAVIDLLRQKDMFEKIKGSISGAIEEAGRLIKANESDMRKIATEIYTANWDNGRPAIGVYGLLSDNSQFRDLFMEALKDEDDIIFNDNRAYHSYFTAQMQQADSARSILETALGEKAAQAKENEFRGLVFQRWPGVEAYSDLELITRSVNRSLIEEARKVLGMQEAAPAAATAVAPQTGREVGGIDFDPTNMNLQIKRDGKGVALPISQQNLDAINIDGIYPVIINIVPINAQNLPILLGLAPKDPAARDEEQLALI